MLFMLSHVLLDMFLIIHHQLQLVVQHVQLQVQQIVLEHGNQIHVKIIITKILLVYVQVVMLLEKLVLVQQLLLFLLVEVVMS